MIKSKKINPTDIQASLIHSLTSSCLKMIPDLAEANLDVFLSEGVLKEIPVISMLIKLAQAGRNVRDLLFIKKITSFLRELNKVPQADRIKFSQKIESDQNLKLKISETLLLVVERLDDMSKPSIIAKIFAKYMQEEINFATMKRLISAIDRANMPDLRSLGNFNQRDKSGISSRLVGLGLANIIGMGSEGYEIQIYRGLFNYSLNEDGDLLRKILNDQKSRAKKV